jgi:hypothetical protein
MDICNLADEKQHKIETLKHYKFMRYEKFQSIYLDQGDI